MTTSIDTGLAPKYITVADFCGAFSVGRSTAYSLFRARKVRVVKLGKRTLVNVESAEAYFDSLPSIDGGAE